MGGFSFFQRKGAKNKKKYTKVDMGDNMSFYWNEELKRYVERGKEDEAAQETAPPPPPRRVNKSPRAAGKQSETKTIIRPGTGGIETRYAALPGFKTIESTSETKIAPFAFPAPNRNGKSPITTFVPKILPVEDVSDNTDNSTNTAPATDDEKKEDGVAESPVAGAQAPADGLEPVTLGEPEHTTSDDQAPTTAGAGEPALPETEEHPPIGGDESAAMSMQESGTAHTQDALDPPEVAMADIQAPDALDAQDTAMGDSQEPLPENCVSAGVQSATLSEAPCPTLAGPPEVDEIPSPWVAYDYSLWTTEVWERVSAHNAELYYYHWIQFTVQQGWTSTDWEVYSAQYPEQYEYVDYYCHEWQEVKGTPTLPLPNVGLPLASGEGPVTEQWLQEMEASINATADLNGVTDDATEDVHAHDAQDLPALAAEGSAATESPPPDDTTLFTPQLSPSALKSPCMDVLEPEAQMSPQLDKELLVRDTSLMPFAPQPSPEPDPDDVDVWPREELCAAIEFYAAPIRPESVAGSDDDNKYRELQSCVDGPDGAAGLPPPVSRGDCKDDDDGDEEDGYGDVGSIAAVASPSSCKRREHEASIPSGPLSTAAATADADAALQHLEASLEKSEAEKAQRASAAAYAPSMNLSDAHSEAPSSMIVNAPSEAVMEEGDIAGSTTGFSELPNIPEVSSELADELDAPVLPPMHGEVPSTTRPEINISDLEGWGMRVPRGAHTASCAAEAASTEVASEKGSDTNEVGDGPCTSGVNNTGGSGVGHSSGPCRGVGSGTLPKPPSSATELQSPSGTRTGVADSVNRRMLRELGKMNAMLSAACNAENMPLDIIDQFRAVQTASDAMLDAMRGNKKLATETEALAAEPSTANTPATPLRADTELVTPVRTPGIHSDMSTPDIHQITSSNGAMLQPSSTGPSGLHAPFGGAHANPLFSNTLNAETEEDDAWKPESAGPNSEMQASIAEPESANGDIAAALEAQNHLSAELAALQNVHQNTMAQLEQAHADYKVLKEELEAAKDAQASAEADAAAQAQAAAAAAESAELYQQKASAASQELEAALAQIDALKIESCTAAEAAQSSSEQLAALQEQVQELETDVFEGMCALGIESDRVAALVNALVSNGVDPNPILQDVENEHLESAVAGEMGMEDEEAPVGGCEGEVDDTADADDKSQVPCDAEQEGHVHEDLQAPLVAEQQPQSPVEPAEQVSASCTAAEHQTAELAGMEADSAWAAAAQEESQPGSDGWALDQLTDSQPRDASCSQDDQAPVDVGASQQGGFSWSEVADQQGDASWGQQEQAQLAGEHQQGFDGVEEPQDQQADAAWGQVEQAQLSGEPQQGFALGEQEHDLQEDATWGQEEPAELAMEQHDGFAWGEQPQEHQEGDSWRQGAQTQEPQADVAWPQEQQAELAGEQPVEHSWGNQSQDQQGGIAWAQADEQPGAGSWAPDEQAPQGDAAWGQHEQAQLANGPQQQGFAWEQAQDQQNGFTWPQGEDQQEDISWGQGEQAQLACEQEQGFAWDQCDPAQQQPGGTHWAPGAQAQGQHGSFSWPGAEKQPQEQQGFFSWPGAGQSQDQQQHGAWAQEPQAQLAADAYQQAGFAWPQGDQTQDQQAGVGWGPNEQAQLAGDAYQQQGNFTWPNGEQQQFAADAYQQQYAWTQGEPAQAAEGGYQQGQYAAWPQGEQADVASQQGQVPWGQGNEQAQYGWGAGDQAQDGWGDGWGAGDQAQDDWGTQDQAGWGADSWGVQQQAGIPAEF